MNWDATRDWQELIGAAMGPFLAVILSAIALLVKEKWDEQKQRKETHRRVEISITSSLNDVYNAR